MGNHLTRGTAAEQRALRAAIRDTGLLTMEAAAVRIVAALHAAGERILPMAGPDPRDTATWGLIDAWDDEADTDADKLAALAPWIQQLTEIITAVSGRRCDDRSPSGEPCVLVAGHGVHHCGPRPEDGGYRQRWAGESEAHTIERALKAEAALDAVQHVLVRHRVAGSLADELQRALVGGRQATPPLPEVPEEEVAVGPLLDAVHMVTGVVELVVQVPEGEYADWLGETVRVVAAPTGQENDHG